MKKIYAFCGLSGTGKSTIADMISLLCNIPIVISVTTRPIRPGEENHKDYHFISDNEFNLISDLIICRQDFHVAGNEIWRYGIFEDEITDKCIMVLTPSGIQELKDRGYDVTSILIDVDEDTRIKRIYKRKDNQSEEEIKRRNRDDKKVFENFIPDYIIRNDDNIADCINTTINLIMK